MSHSAEVDMNLHLETGEVLSVSQCGPDFLILEHPTRKPPMKATLVIDVDGSISRYPSYLAEGIDGDFVKGSPVPPDDPA